MICPKCGNLKTAVKKSTRAVSEALVLRMRRCADCGVNFHTEERPMTARERTAENGSGKQ